MRDTVAVVEEITVPTDAGPLDERVEIRDGAIYFYATGGDLIGEASPANGFVQYATSNGAYAQLWATGPAAMLLLGPEDYPAHTTQPATFQSDIDFARQSGRIVIIPPTVDGNGFLRVFMNGESLTGAIPNFVIDGGFGLPADLRLNDATLPRGYITHIDGTTDSAAMSGAGVIVHVPDTEYTITNDSGMERKYLVIVNVRVNMNSGSYGLYRPLVTDHTPAAVSTGAGLQFDSNAAGGTGQTGGVAFAVVDVANGATQDVAAGGLRVSGGSGSDVFVSGQIYVFDIGGV